MDHGRMITTILLIVLLAVALFAMYREYVAQIKLRERMCDLDAQLQTLQSVASAQRETRRFVRQGQSRLAARFAKKPDGDHNQ
jgi:hypothetical protein